MNKLEYLLYAIKNNYLKDLNWYFTFMTTVTDEHYKNQYVEFKSGILYVKYKEELVKLNNVVKNTPAYLVNDVIKLPKNTINNDTDITTTIGLIILNYILLHTTIGKRVTYINDHFNIGKIEDRIGELLNNDVITVTKYKKFVDNAIFLEKFSRIVTVSDTYKNITPPDGLDVFKKKTLKKYQDKYGDTWYKDHVKVTEFEDELKAYYNDYIKDDPSNDVFLSGKIKNNAGLKKYLTFGLAFGLEDDPSETEHVVNSLLDGPPKDKDKIAGMFNSVRLGSYGRGKQTQEGGSAAKVMLRATASTHIGDKDCKSKLGKSILVNDNIVQSLVGRYLLTSKGPKVIKDITEANKYIGKRITIRSPQFCKSKGSGFCKICSGDAVSEYGNFTLVTTNISNTLLYISMAMMHNTSINSINTNPLDGIR